MLTWSSNVVRLWLLAFIVPGLLTGLGACNRAILLSESLDEPGLIYYLPKTIVKLEIAAYGVLDPAEPAHPNIRELRIESAAPETQADLSRAYSLHYKPAAYSHDRICVGVDARGLLAAVEAAADDKTGDIIVSLAKLAGRVIGPGAFATLPTRESIAAQKFRSLHLEIDPLNRTHWQQVNRAIRSAFKGYERPGSDFRVDHYTFKVDDIDHYVRDSAEPDHCPEGSVCYRTRAPARLTLGSLKGLSSSQYVQVVNRRVIGHIDVTRALMVEKITRLTFKEGVLAGAQIKKPSEGLALAKLPLTVIDAITTSALAAPGDFLSKFNGISSANATALLASSKTDAANVALMMATLKEIREGDLITKSAEVEKAESQVFQLKCDLVK
ncbi:MAG: hypothetical protein ACKVP7_04610 [Hyphomicrobiaceae bacterium]